MDAWLATALRIGPLTTTVGTVVVVGLSAVAVASLTPAALVGGAYLRRRRAAKAAGLPAYAGGALGGQPFAGARWAGRSACSGFRFIVRASGTVFRVGLILALLSLWGHLAAYAVNRVADIYQAKSLNPPTHRPMPKEYAQIQSDARAALSDPKRAARQHESLIHEFIFDWLL